MRFGGISAAICKYAPVEKSCCLGSSAAGSRSSSTYLNSVKSPVQNSVVKHRRAFELRGGKRYKGREEVKGEKQSRDHEPRGLCAPRGFRP